MPSDDANTDGLHRWSMLASALSGRTLQVAPVAPGGSAWTDATTVFVDGETDVRNQIESVAVQASLLAAGSLEPDVMRKLSRRPALTRRYLAVEGHRALAANEDLLPQRVWPLIDHDVALRTVSPAASLSAALSRETIPDPPHAFGVIHPRKLLESKIRADASAPTGKHIPRPQHDKPLAELDEDENDDAGDVADFSSPVGGGGGLGKLLQKMLGVVRKLGEGGQPGADAPTHTTRSATRHANSVVSTAVASAVDDATGERRGTKYPEWDVQHTRYRRDWCTVQEVQPRLADDAELTMSDRLGLRRPLARLALGLDRYHRQVQGDDIDIDATVEARVEVMAGSAP
ncbi:MAG: nitric oxide reductase NorD protein, partial [Mycobacterium sp.]|nr:nitric oxide reductase NorD protein [Mycobacterium sp.]